MISPDVSGIVVDLPAPTTYIQILIHEAVGVVCYQWGGGGDKCTTSHTPGLTGPPSPAFNRTSAPSLSPIFCQALRMQPDEEVKMINTSTFVRLYNVKDVNTTPPSTSVKFTKLGPITQIIHSSKVPQVFLVHMYYKGLQALALELYRIK